MLDDLKIAIVCDWLTVFAGAERVVFELHQLFPKAPIYTSLYDKKRSPQFRNADIRESWMKYLPFARKFHRLYFPFMPKVFEGMDFSEYDIVISSSHSASKGIITKPNTLHISYCHSPMRYVWDQSHVYQKNYSAFSYLRFIYSPILHKVRQWDRLAAERVDKFLANSDYISSRILKYYKKNSSTLYPPVDLNKFNLYDGEREGFVAVGRLIPYKRFDLLIDVFNKLKLPLNIVGDGPLISNLQLKANSNIKFLGRVSDDDLRKLYGRSKALIFPQLEDFGIVPLEAMACGTPVIAFGKGGALETIKENESGLFFDEQTEESLTDALNRFQKIHWKASIVASSVEKFSVPRFRSEFLHVLEATWKEHKKMLISK